LAGDIVCHDIVPPLREQFDCIIEVNAPPGHRVH
jgi:hypothetical protein